MFVLQHLTKYFLILADFYHTFLKAAAISMKFRICLDDYTLGP